MDPFGPERVDCHGRDDGGINAAGKAEDDAGKTGLVDVVAKPEDAGAPVGFLEPGKCGEAAVGAAPAEIVIALPGERLDRLGELRHLEGQRPVAVEPEGATVEDQFVLPAALVDVDHRQPGLDDAGDRYLLAGVGLALPIGRAVGNDQQFGPCFKEAFADLLEPDVLADRQAKPQATESDRPRQGSGLEDPEFVEYAVVGKLDLVAERLNLACVEQRHGIVDLAALGPWRADHHTGAAVGGVRREILDRLPARILEGRLQHQVFRRVAGDKEFRERHEIGARGGCRVSRRPRLLEVAVNIADYGIKLGDGDADGIGQVCCHIAGLARRRMGGNRHASIRRAREGRRASAFGQASRRVRDRRHCPCG